MTFPSRRTALLASIAVAMLAQPALAQEKTIGIAVLAGLALWRKVDLLWVVLAGSAISAILL